MYQRYPAYHIQQSNSFADFEHDGHVATNLLDEILDSLIAFLDVSNSELHQ
jgi:hypothetical protein